MSPAAIVAPVMGQFSLADVAAAAGLNAQHVYLVVQGNRLAAPTTVSRLRMGVARLRSRSTEGQYEWSAYYRTALALAALALGESPDAVQASDPARKATKDAAWMRATGVRKLALYLMNAGLGLRQTDVARAAGVTKQMVSLAVREIEEKREAPAFDALVVKMEGWILGAAG